MTHPTTQSTQQPTPQSTQLSVQPDGKSPAPSDLSFATISPERRAWQRFRRHRLAMIGLGILIVLIFMAIAAPIIAPDPYALSARAIKKPPSFEHILGTDTAGRDGWARLVYASRVSLSVGVVSVSIYLLIATILGSLAGYYGGRVDDVIMRLTDIILCFPELIIIITVVSVVGASIYNVMLVIGLLGWPGLARLVRAQILSLREQQFVEAAHCLGIPTRRIIFRHILPNVVPYILVSATFGVAGAILTEAGLSFLGLGVQPPTASWGNMLSGAQNLTILERYSWIWLPPGLMIGISVLAINFIGDGLRDALDPRMILR